MPLRLINQKPDFQKIPTTLCACRVEPAKTFFHAILCLLLAKYERFRRMKMLFVWLILGKSIHSPRLGLKTNKKQRTSRQKEFSRTYNGSDVAGRHDNDDNDVNSGINGTERHRTATERFMHVKN